jgi:hypothetical protein
MLINKTANKLTIILCLYSLLKSGSGRNGGACDARRLPDTCTAFWSRNLKGRGHVGDLDKMVG